MAWCPGRADPGGPKAQKLSNGISSSPVGLINGQFYGLGAGIHATTDMQMSLRCGNILPKQWSLNVSNSGHGTDNATLVFTDSKRRDQAFTGSRGVRAWEQFGEVLFSWFDPIKYRACGLLSDWSSGAWKSCLLPTNLEMVVETIAVWLIWNYTKSM